MKKTKECDGGMVEQSRKKAPTGARSASRGHIYVQKGGYKRKSVNVYPDKLSHLMRVKYSYGLFSLVGKFNSISENVTAFIYAKSLYIVSMIFNPMYNIISVIKIKFQIFTAIFLAKLVKHKISPHFHTETPRQSAQKGDRMARGSTYNFPCFRVDYCKILNIFALLHSKNRAIFCFVRMSRNRIRNRSRTRSMTL